MLGDEGVVGECHVELANQFPLARRVGKGRLDRVARERREIIGREVTSPYHLSLEAV